jgi:hypothetical protein
MRVILSLVVEKEGSIENFILKQGDFRSKQVAQVWNPTKTVHKYIVDLAKTQRNIEICEINLDTYVVDDVAEEFNVQKI